MQQIFRHNPAILEKSRHSISPHFEQQWGGLVRFKESIYMVFFALRGKQTLY